MDFAPSLTHESFQETDSDRHDIQLLIDELGGVTPKISPLPPKTFELRKILTEEEGIGNFVNDDDTVYYKHETRFDNGQLVDLNETRKVADKFIMNDPRYLDFLRSAFLKMRRN